MHADHVRRQDIDRLAQHAGLGLDSAYAPADHADAIDHGHVRIGADHRVGEINAILLLHAACEVFQIDLVHDADSRRHDLHPVEGLHAPFQETVALSIALKLDLHIESERIGRIVMIDLHGMIDDELDRHQRLDQLGIFAELARCAAHGGEVGERRKAGEVLQHDAGDDERNLLGA